jgi:outer membrane murein-binding lipoprotein Lpp
LASFVCQEAIKVKIIVAAAVLASFALAGCQQASSPDTVNKDVSSAQADAAKDTQKAVQDQAKTDASANADVAGAEAKADSKMADSAYDTAITEAQGRHDVATKKCEILAGDQQKACKDQADAALEQAKANAKAKKAAVKGS